MMPEFYCTCYWWTETGTFGLEYHLKHGEVGIENELHQIPPDGLDSAGEETIWDISKFHYDNLQNHGNSYYLAFD